MTFRIRRIGPTLFGDDVELALGLADRAALAVDHARLVRRGSDRAANA